MRNLLKIFLLGLIAKISIFGAESDLVLQFDGKRAFENVQKQVAFGPRPAGSPELQKTREYLENQLKSWGLEVSEQSFTNETPHGKISFANIIARSPESGIYFFKAKPKLILASHYDTKWFSNIKFVGANDGGSSTGVLLEVARIVAQKHFSLSTASIEFVFFDGEEAIESYTDKDGLYGARHFVEELKTEKTKIDGVVLMDMIGDKDLFVQIPDGDAHLTQRIYKASETLGYREYFHAMLQGMLDDHAPFLNADIPAIDLIDFNYGPANRFWHTEEDTLDKISPESLKIMGQTILKFLENYDSK
jgi:glutaminyl-peptide cyclotransferase